MKFKTVLYKLFENDIFIDGDIIKIESSSFTEASKQWEKLLKSGLDAETDFD